MCDDKAMRRNQLEIWLIISSNLNLIPKTYAKCPKENLDIKMPMKYDFTKKNDF